MLVAIYHMLTRRTTYQDLGEGLLRPPARRAPSIGCCRISSVKSTSSASNPWLDHRGAFTGYFLSIGVSPIRSGDASDPAGGGRGSEWCRDAQGSFKLRTSG